MGEAGPRDQGTSGSTRSLRQHKKDQGGLLLSPVARTVQHLGLALRDGKGAGEGDCRVSGWRVPGSYWKVWRWRPEPSVPSSLCPTLQVTRAGTLDYMVRLGTGRGRKGMAGLVGKSWGLRPAPYQ